MRRLSVRCKRCGKEWPENGFHVYHESEKIRTCPSPDLKGNRCDGKLEIRLLGSVGEPL